MAAFGPTPYEDQPVWESAVAASTSRITTVFNIGPREGGFYAMGYAVWNVQTQQWSEGLIPMGVYTSAFDPTIAYDPVTDRFIACAIVDQHRGAASDRYVAVSRYGGQQFETWRPIVGPVVDASFDKPVIVAAESTEAGQELYIVHMENTASSFSGYAYQRSSDGGETWHGGTLGLGIDGPVVHGRFCAQPAVAGAGPLYIAYMAELPVDLTGTIRFLVGTDIDSDEHAGEVEFAQLTGATVGGGGDVPLSWPPLPIPLSVPVRNAHVEIFVPGAFNVRTVPQIAADPFDPDRLFLACHDIVVDAQGQPTSDVDVFVRVLTRVEGNEWEAGPPIRVNDDGVDPAEDKDQFLPVILVDDAVNILFYDDYHFTQYDDDRTGPPKFDVYYARGSFESGELVFQNWFIKPLPSPVQPPPLDFTCLQPGQDLESPASTSASPRRRAAARITRPLRE